LLEQPASAAARIAAPARVIMAPRFTPEWLVFTVYFLSVVPGVQPSRRGAAPAVVEVFVCCPVFPGEITMRRRPEWILNGFRWIHYGPDRRVWAMASAALSLRPSDGSTPSGARATLHA
jgi:hypothetical protein